MRVTDLDSVLFPVRPRQLCFAANGKFVPVGSHVVLINCDTGSQVGVVGKDYRLVTNREALGFARECARQLFGGVKPEELEVFNVDSPSSGSYCHIDLIHKGFELNFLKKEVYLPFVRMTNSYNRSRALGFKIGYCRKVCSNGMIFEQEAIRFSFAHSRADIGPSLDFRIEKGKLDALRQKFETDAERLHFYRIPERTGLPLFFKALSLPMLPTGDDVSQRTVDLFDGLHCVGNRLLSEYFGQFGTNAYALLNAATDLASHPDKVYGLTRSAHSMQTSAGTWSREFAALVSDKEKPLDLDEYLGDYINVNSWRGSLL